MNSKKAAQFVEVTKPSLLYISGKTCTGKTTFAKEIATRYGYPVIFLDDIVHDAVIKPLSLQAREGEFYPKATGSMYFRNLVSRFKGATATTRNSLPNNFWENINPDDFKQFCIDGIITPSIRAGITKYCNESTEASAKRLATLKRHLRHVQVVEI